MTQHVGCHQPSFLEAGECQMILRAVDLCMKVYIGAQHTPLKVAMQLGIADGNVLLVTEDKGRSIKSYPTPNPIHPPKSTRAAQFAELWSH